MRIFLFLLFGFLMFSCTIQKRQHLSGYHITFHKHYKNKEIEKENSRVENNEENAVIADNSSKISADFSNPVLPTQSVESNNIPNTKTLSSIEKITDKNIDKISTKIKKDKLEKIGQNFKGKSRNNPNTEESNTTSAFALLGFFFAIFGLMVFILVGFPFLMSTAAIVLSSIALRRLKTGKDKKRGRGLAIAGLVIGILTILAFIILVIAILLFASGAYFA